MPRFISMRYAPGDFRVRIKAIATLTYVGIKWTVLDPDAQGDKQIHCNIARRKIHVNPGRMDPTLHLHRTICVSSSHSEPAPCSGCSTRFYAVSDLAPSAASARAVSACALAVSSQLRARSAARCETRASLASSPSNASTCRWSSQWWFDTCCVISQ